jgi:hypothetical protein
MVFTHTCHTEKEQINRFAVTNSQSHLIIHFSRELLVDNFIIFVTFGATLHVEITFNVLKPTGYVMLRHV